jgi:hypothetical protein
VDGLISDRPDLVRQAMAERARLLLYRLGHAVPPADTAYWYAADYEYLRYLATHSHAPDVARPGRSAVSMAAGASSGW